MTKIFKHPVYPLAQDVSGDSLRTLIKEQKVPTDTLELSVLQLIEYRYLNKLSPDTYTPVYFEGVKLVPPTFIQEPKTYVIKYPKNKPTSFRDIDEFLDEKSPKAYNYLVDNLSIEMSEPQRVEILGTWNRCFPDKSQTLETLNYEGVKLMGIKNG